MLKKMVEHKCFDDKERAVIVQAVNDVLLSNVVITFLVITAFWFGATRANITSLYVVAVLLTLIGVYQAVKECKLIIKE